MASSIQPDAILSLASHAFRTFLCDLETHHCGSSGHRRWKLITGNCKRHNPSSSLHSRNQRHGAQEDATCSRSRQRRRNSAGWLAPPDVWIGPFTPLPLNSGDAHTRGGAGQNQEPLTGWSRCVLTVPIAEIQAILAVGARRPGASDETVACGPDERESGRTPGSRRPPRIRQSTKLLTRPTLYVLAALNRDSTAQCSLAS